MGGNLNKKTLADLGLIVGVCMLFYLIHFFPYLEHFSERLFYFSDPDDIKITSWNTWHFVEAIKSHTNPFYTQYMFAPEGHSLLMHAYTIYFGVINFFIGNVPLSINLGIAMQLVAAGVGFFYFTRIWIRNWFACLAVSYLVVYNSYVLGKVGVHYNLVLIGLLPFILILFHQAFKDGTLVRFGKLAFLSVLMVAGLFMDYYIVFYALSYFLVYLLYFRLTPIWQRAKKYKKWITVILLLVIGHIGGKALRVSGVDEKGAVWAASDVRLLVTPTSESAFLNEYAISGLLNTQNDNKIFLGYGLLALFLVSLIIWWKNKLKDNTTSFLLFATIMYLLVVLPVIRFAEKDLFYTITGWVHYIPFVNNVRAPDRFILMVHVFMTLFSLAVIFNNSARSWIKPSLVFLLVIVSFINHKQQEMNSIANTQESKLLALCEGKNVLSLPFGIRDGYSEFGAFNEHILLLQQQHKFKDVSGYLSRVSSQKKRRYNESRFYKSIVAMQDKEKELWSTILFLTGKKEHQIDAIYLSKEYLDNTVPTLKAFLDNSDYEKHIYEDEVLYLLR
jgi:hypothetical protein